MAWFEGAFDEDRLKIFENKVTEIRKVLLGTLFLAKNMYRDNLEQEPAGVEVLQIIEAAEEDFLNSSLGDRFEQFEDVLDLILKRAKGLFLLVEYISKNKQR